MEWQARWARGLKYKVSHKNQMFVERFVVDLLAGICSCKFWRLCEMSCPHACCAIFDKGDNAEDYCNDFYSPAAYLATYELVVAAVANGDNVVGLNGAAAATDDKVAINTAIAALLCYFDILL
ncbi:hypothetical protein Ahy_B08g093691 [Arachis hypogaea]|uniref:SWIM-type domain-containing protein n=1 Tax=Arachis hypogaea TaxID=3818 RepID=A0A444Y6Q2_ARAHY|nr:hypothetical protein Ahy_B08g093691 [Arachis hypogaea]